MKTINEIFKEKKFDEKSIKYLENAIDEFIQIYGRFVSKEELINRVEKNIDLVEFKETLDKEDSLNGVYDVDTKCISIKHTLNEELIKSVFFHEFLHAIATEGNTTGFFRRYSLFSKENENNGILLGRGWNEGFVQMMTKERDRIIAHKDIPKGYPILTKSVKKFTELYDKEKMLNAYFNNPGEILKIFKDNGMNVDIEFLHNFDIIYKYEKEIIKNYYSMFSLLIGFDEDTTEKRIIKDTKERIIKKYVNAVLNKKIENSTQFEEMFNDIDEMYNIFKSSITSETLGKIVDRTNPEILNNIDNMNENVKKTIKSELLHRKFTSLSHQEQLDMLMDENNEYLKNLSDVLYFEYQGLMKEYVTKMFDALYEENKDFSIEKMEEWVLDFNDVLQYIKNNNLSFDNLKIESNYFTDVGRVFNLYNYKGDENYERITSFVDNYLTGEQEEFKRVNDIEKWKKLNIRIKEELKLDLTDVFEGDNGGILINCGEEQFFITKESNRIIRSEDETVSIESLNELRIINKENEFDYISDRLRRLKELNAPKAIYEYDEEKLKRLKKMINEVRESIKNKSNIYNVKSSLENQKNETVYNVNEIPKTISNKLEIEEDEEER